MRKHPRPDVPGRRRSGLLRPGFDLLEVRFALSALSVVSVAAASASTGGTSALLRVRFDRPIDPNSVGFDDFDILKVGASGRATPLGPRAGGYVEQLDSTDPTGSTIALALRSPLPVGDYEIALDASSLIEGEDGSTPAPSGPDAAVGAFAVGMAPASGPATGPVALGPIGSSVVDRAGSLDLSSGSVASQAYRVTLAPGHRWRLGLAVESKSPGAPSPTLALADSAGDVVATSRLGLPGDPSDPYLFAGLDPGTYEVTVSDAGRAGSTASDFAFDLQAVADPADSPTEVLGLRLDHADPASAEATGFTLQFSGAIATADLNAPGAPALALVDSSGKTLPVHSLGYDAGLGQLSVLFDQPLPAGTYSVVIPGGGKLVDLAGLVPEAAGLPTGTLGTFAVADPVLTAGDLGPIFPSESAGVSSRVAVAPGGSTSVEFTVLEAGTYSIAGLGGGAGVDYSLQDSGGDALALRTSVGSASGAVDAALDVGTYTLTLTNSGSIPETVPIRVVQKLSNAADLILGGVTQGDALSLRIVSPAADFGADLAMAGSQATAGSPAPAAVAGPPGPIAPESSGGTGSGSGSGTGSGMGLVSSSTTTSATVTSAPVSGPSAPVASGATLLFAVGPVGLPSTMSAPIGVVGPSGVGGFALASTGEGLPSGLRGVPEAADTGSIGRFGPLPEEFEVGPDAPDSSTLGAGILGQAAAVRREDDRSLADSAWLARLVEHAGNWVAPLPLPVVEAEAKVEAPSLGGEPSAIVAPALVSSEAVVEEPGRLSLTSAAPTAGIGLLAMLAYRFRRRPGRPEVKRPGRIRSRAAFAGPHRLTKSRAR